MMRPTITEIDTVLKEFRYESSRGTGLRELPLHVRGPLAFFLYTWFRGSERQSAPTEVPR